MITQDRLKELFILNDRGVFTRKSTGYSYTNAQSHGYTVIWIDGKSYRAHRLVWLWHHGAFPSKDLDHINRRRSENALDNLREATVRENSQNRADQSALGVGVTAYRGGFRARAQVGVERKHLGVYATREEAVLSRALYLAHGIATKPPARKGRPRKYTGVSFHKKRNRWMAQTRKAQGKYLGSFLTEQEALSAVKNFYKLTN